MSEPKYKVGDRVYCLDELGAGISTVQEVFKQPPNAFHVYKLFSDSSLRDEDCLFTTKEALLEHIKEQLEELE